MDLRQRDTLEIFFDDNIGHTTAHIVDAREVHTGEPLPFKVHMPPQFSQGKGLRNGRQPSLRGHDVHKPAFLQAIVGKHMLKVEPLNAILDPHYFVRAVHECVVAWLKSHADTADASVDRNPGYR